MTGIGTAGIIPIPPYTGRWAGAGVMIPGDGVILRGTEVIMAVTTEVGTVLTAIMAGVAEVVINTSTGVIPNMDISVEAAITTAGRITGMVTVVSSIPWLQAEGDTEPVRQPSPVEETG